MLTLQPKKDGGPNVKFFESAEVLAQLDGVKQWLLKNCKKVRTKPASQPLSFYFQAFINLNINKNYSLRLYFALLYRAFI